MAHIAGLPAEELLPWASGAGAALVAARVWVSAIVAKTRPRAPSSTKRT